MATSSKKIQLTYPSITVSEPFFVKGDKSSMFSSPDHYEIKISNSTLEFPTKKEADAIYKEIKNFNNENQWLEFFQSYLLRRIPQRAYIIGTSYKESMEDYNKLTIDRFFNVETLFSTKRGTYLKLEHSNFGKKRITEFVFDSTVNDRALGWLKIGEEWKYGDWLYIYENLFSIASGAEKLIVKAIIPPPNKFELPNLNKTPLLSKKALDNLINVWNFIHSRDKKSDRLLDNRKKEEDIKPYLSKLSIDGVPAKIQALVIVDAESNRRKKTITKEQIEKTIDKIWNDFYSGKYDLAYGGDFQTGVYAGGGGVGYNSSDPRIKELTNKPSLDSRTGLIYYFDIPFTTEDIEDILASSKSILNAKFTPNKQFNIQPMVFIKDKVNGGEHTFSVAQIGILASFHNKNKNKTASRKDFSYAEGGSLQAHGIKEGDTFMKTISGTIQKVKDKNEKIVYINLANGERGSQPPLPFNNGGMVSEDLFENYNKQPKKLAEIVDFYMAKYDEGEMDYQDTKNFLKEVEAIGYTFDYGLDNEPYGLRPIGTKLKEYDEGGEVTYFLNKDGIKVRSKVEPKRKLTEAEWMAKHNESKEARTYGFGGLFSMNMNRPKPIDLNQQQVRLKSGEYVQVFNQQGDSLMVMELNKLGTGASPKYVRLSDVDMTSFKNGGALIGNQKRIDMNKNGKIDAEDFKLLRSSMNGAWRNERKHVNHNEDYEVRYARKKPARTGYKGKRKFATGGEVGKIYVVEYEVNGNKNTSEYLLYKNDRVEKMLPSNAKIVSIKEKMATGGTIFKNRVKPTSQKMSSGAEVKKGNRGGVMVLAKKIRKDGESWKDALKRAGQQLK